jgi:hypothetical protein
MENLKMKNIFTWFETRRDSIEQIVSGIQAIISLVVSFIIRILIGATIIMAYFFINATPETTVFSLSQNVYSESFWVTSIWVAVIYSVVHYSLRGTFGGGRGISKNYYQVSACSSDSMKSSDQK